MPGRDAFQVLEHLQTVIFYSGSFFVTWTWVLVYYGITQALAGAPPLIDHANGAAAGNSWSFWIVKLQCIAVCVATWQGVKKVNEVVDEEWVLTIVTSLEFLPLALFSGLFTASLGLLPEWSSGPSLLGLVFQWMMTSLLYAFPTVGFVDQYEELIKLIRNTANFSLAVAWNDWVCTIVAYSLDQFAFATVYLLLMCAAAARLTAPEKDKEDTISNRQKFLARTLTVTTCALAVLDWVILCFGESISRLLIAWAAVIGLSLISSVIIKRQRVEMASREIRAHRADYGKHAWMLGVFLWIPCTWLKCPWLPLGMLAGAHTHGVKARWIKLAQESCSLTASVLAARFLMLVVNKATTHLHLCSSVGNCPNPLAAVGVEVIIALVSTAGATFFIHAFAPNEQSDDEGEEEEEEEGRPGSPNRWARLLHV